ncbi:MAG: ATP-binding protein [Candidatus Omnitrophota bacterium]|nr:ATP-binding protein [Candidatus Omnitrophota bacterium]
MSIKLKLAILFLAFALIPMLLICALTFRNYENSLKVGHVSALRDIVFFKADKIETYFASLKANIAVAQGFYNIKRNLPILTRLADKTDDPEFRAAQKMLDSQLSVMQAALGLADIMLVNPDGRIVYSRSLGDSSVFLSTLPDPGQKSFMEGKNRIYVSDIFFNKTHGNKLSILVVAPAVDLNGVFTGVIVFEMDIDQFYDLIQDATGLGKTGETLLGKKIGNEVLYLNPLRYDSSSSFNRRITIGSKIGIPVQEAAQGRTGAGSSIDYRMQKVIAAWQYIPSLDWGIVAKIDAMEVFSDVEKLRKLLLIGLFYIFVLVCVTTLLFSESFTRPINKLVKGAEIVGGGNLDYKIASDHKDEVGKLSRAFDKMTYDLQKTTTSRDDLNKEIDARKQLEEELRKIQEDLTNAQTVGNIGNWRLNVQRNELIWSDESYRIFGIPKGTPLTYDFFLSVIHPEDRDYVDKKWKAGMAGEDYDIEHRIIADGNVRWVREKAFLEFDKKGALLAGFGIAQDITKRKQAEEVLKRDKDALEKLVNEKAQELLAAQKEINRTKRLSDIGTLAATVAHELRNPLASIGLSAYHIKKIIKDPHVKADLSAIAKRISEADQIINNILSYSRIKIGRFQAIKINSILKECIDEATDRFPSETIVVNVKIDHTEDLSIEADPLQMKEVFGNILNNAFDALNKNAGIIDIESNTKGSTASILIKDNGEGIEKEHLTKIFDPFFTTKTKGTGLGLAVCNLIIKLHDGSITIESDKGKGTAVTITLPIQRQKDA